MRFGSIRHLLTLNALRVVVSTMFAVSAVLFCGLWVRSYGKSDALIRDLPSSHVELCSGVGHVRWMWTRPFVGKSPHSEWKHLAVSPIRLGDVSRFYWTKSPHTFAVLVPHWFLVLLTSLLAALPWISSKFSLRTMLTVTTVAAVFFAALASSLRK